MKRIKQNYKPLQLLLILLVIATLSLSIGTGLMLTNELNYGPTILISFGISGLSFLGVFILTALIVIVNGEEKLKRLI